MRNEEAKPPLSLGDLWKYAALALFAIAAGILGAVFFASSNTRVELPPTDTESRVTGRLVRHAEPQLVPNFAFKDADGKVQRLSDWRGRMVLLNLWATWCAPCKTEMPSLDRLQAKLGDRDLIVLPLSTDRGGIREPASFFSREGITHLKVYNDDSGEAAIQMKAAGLPLTVLVNKNGREVARLVGPADWDSPEILAQLQTLEDGKGDGQAAARLSP